MVYLLYMNKNVVSVHPSWEIAERFAHQMADADFTGSNRFRIRAMELKG